MAVEGTFDLGMIPEALPSSPSAGALHLNVGLSASQPIRFICWAAREDIFTVETALCILAVPHVPCARPYETEQV